MAMLFRFVNDRANAEVVFEDDGKTAYAYLIVNEAIVGDVWLYNVCKAPAIPEWTDRESCPFANPLDFVLEDDFRPLTDSDEIAVDWDLESTSVQQVTITLRGKKHALLRPGSKPGWCRLAAKASPVARPLDEFRNA